MILENPPAHDPQANGEAERAVQEIKAQIRCLKLGFESWIGAAVDSTLPYHGMDHRPRCRPDKPIFGGGGWPQSTLSDPFNNV